MVVQGSPKPLAGVRFPSPVHKLLCANKPKKLFNTDKKLHKTKKVNYLFIVYLVELKANNRIDNFYTFLNKKLG